MPQDLIWVMFCEALSVIILTLTIFSLTIGYREKSREKRLIDGYKRSVKVTTLNIQEASKPMIVNYAALLRLVVCKICNEDERDKMTERCNNIKTEFESKKASTPKLQELYNHLSEDIKRVTALIMAYGLQEKAKPYLDPLIKGELDLNTAFHNEVSLQDYAKMTAGILHYDNLSSIINSFGLSPHSNGRAATVLNRIINDSTPGHSIYNCFIDLPEQVRCAECKDCIDIGHRAGISIQTTETGYDYSCAKCAKARESRKPNSSIDSKVAG
ncbi:MAG: hypothetical protein UU65_C0002G0279 [candidate division CPR2 bacterium GW2011_GWC1_41_48]|uniref:Uncharacterized protein n=1 Tax=candidate division CPR2 bacterium GW2011_GWC1_41_48 TaxID=1618344 RepID=A0A0G0YIX4_UNCC2|nr:MAG: hypothetical protein UT47_C0002G0025 [candidate division CPR2 bacterium GW2011_GWC2_39_35]KKR27229.1 MAG: hypothetical protein UT59_C0065G0003 [candidate division CPR2 bacterium GW2011_GWD1_39_7]KKR29004.1 MAG: hypothetical protein UT60_C0008G0047 [candidate division CPR2 bacterium GW2011_GWD2_39_7]KKS09501.1 MAG: hypothetical protein UU65_C0002G0279 [candidate division CPR2 bacterium GW2011_GWC1_41_48]OGB57446.1 MAG: hypothetical protein A2Y27_00295 [candidate division CPR2 bacterium G